MKNIKTYFKTCTLPGLIITAFATLFFLFCIKSLNDIFFIKPKISQKEIESNELVVYKNMVKIIEAQKKYKQVDWDGDGIKQYAQFIPHLWISVDNKNIQKKVGLIPEAIALSMSSSNLYKGYSFISLLRKGTDDFHITEFDPKNEWAIIAYRPSGKKKHIIFMADNSENVYAKKMKRTPYYFPVNPEKKGWRKIDSKKDLIQFQKIKS